MKTLCAVTVLSMCASLADEGFQNCGIAANAAEARGTVVVETKDGRSLVLVNGVDCSAVAYMVVIDIDSGETRTVKTAKNIGHGTGAFGSLRSVNGRFYTGRGRVLLEFDPDTETWTWNGTPSPKSNHFMSFAEEPGGKRIWAAMNPTCALVSFDPETKTAKEHCRLDTGEHYPQSLAIDAKGWVYAGIGTARANLVGYNPVTGEVRQLVPEKERKHGTGSVRLRADGSVMGRANGKIYRLLDGVATVCAKDEPSPRLVPVGSVYYGRILGQFPDGRRVKKLDLPEKYLIVHDPKTKKDRRIELSYDSGGALLTSLAVGPGGKVYASSCHPMHLVSLDPESGKTTDLGGIPKVGGGNFCAMATDGARLFGVEYAGGRLWAYDPGKDWRPGQATREVVGTPAAELVRGATAENGHFSYLDSEDLAFLCGDKFGAVGTFVLDAPKAGDYFVDFVPFVHTTYCQVQFEFDGKPLGEVYDAKGGTRPGAQISHGPFSLEQGVHRLTMRTLETAGQKPWCALVTAVLRPADIPARQLVVEESGNPEILAQWKSDICRPRTALMHPDGTHVLMAGFAGYGLCGGGIGIYDLKAGTPQLLTAEKDLLASHSCITLGALPNGDVVGGTSINAPGGGHVKATEGELFILDWKTRKLVWHGAPVAGDSRIISIMVGKDGLVYGLSGKSTFFVFDPEQRKVLRSESLAKFGGVPRHALQLAKDGTLYATLSKAILRYDATGKKWLKLADTPATVTGGGALVGGRLYFASRAEIWMYDLPK